VSDLPFEALRADLSTIRASVDAMRLDIVRLESKIDSRPSLMDIMIGIAIVVFGGLGSLVGAAAAVYRLIHG
jgi:hypothetical protein